MELEELLQNGRFVRSLSHSLVLDSSRADDIEQETWLAAIQNQPAQGQPVQSWFYRVILNFSRMMYRKEGRQKKYERLGPRQEPFPTPDEIVSREEVRRRLIKAVLDLEEPYRTVLLCRYYEDQSAREVAKRLDRPLETVRTQLKRGLDQLRERLDNGSSGDRLSWCIALAPFAALKMKNAETAGFFLGLKVKLFLVALAVTSPIFIYFVLHTWVFSEPDAETPAPPEAVVQIAGEAMLIPNATMANPVRMGMDPTGTNLDLVIEGTIQDSRGVPVEGAWVYILWNSVETGSDRSYSVPGIDEKFNACRLVEADWEGRYETTFDQRGDYYICLYDTGDPNLEPYPAMHNSWKPWQGRWVKPPVADVDFTVEIRPTSQVVIRVFDESKGKWLSGFISHATEKKTGNRLSSGDGYMWERYGKNAVITLPVEKEKPTTYLIEACHSRIPEVLTRDVTLLAGERKEVELLLSSEMDPEIRGRVVDAAGKSVEDALVFLGNQIDLRGDEPFKPFNEKRIKDGVRTDRIGKFLIRGRGRQVTVWHAEHSPKTVPVHEASTIRLERRGSIHGQLVDEQGRPVSGVEVSMDRKRKARTDDEGRFHFDSVETGLRGLELPDKRYITIEVSSGERVEPTIDPGIDEVEVKLYSSSAPYSAPEETLLIGRDRISSFTYTREEGGVLHFENILKGRYMLMTRDGALAHVEIVDDSATANFGSAELIVNAKHKTKVYVVPEESSELALLFGGRHASKRVPPSGTVRFHPLPEGRYWVGIDRKGIFATVEVKGISAEVTLEEQR